MYLSYTPEHTDCLSRASLLPLLSRYASSASAAAIVENENGLYLWPSP